VTDPAASALVQSFTTGDGYTCRYRLYPPIGPPRAHVVCIHGIQSHGGWYGYSCRRLAEAGYRVFFLDRRGAGLNEAARGDTPSFTRLLDDLAELLAQVRSGDQALPLFLVAISWGGKPALALERRHPGLVDGLALLCPGIKPRINLSLRMRGRVFLARLFLPGLLIPIPLNDPELFTATPHWQEFIRNDPLSLRKATARFLFESYRLDRYLKRAPPYVRIPVLLLLAQKDRIIDNARTRAFVEQLASPDREVIEYPGAHHTLEFEPNPDLFLADLLRWLERRTAAHKPPG
jgi:alpha-beta hydrolase superfamily lysophospholipase